MSKRALCLKLVVVFVILLLVVPGVQAKTKVSMWLGSQTEEVKPWLDEFVADFNANNPDIQLELTIYPYVSAMRERVIVASAAHAGPDIYSEGSNVISMYVANGLARPLNEFLDRMPDSQDFIPDILRDLTFDGKVSAVPYSLRPFVDAYNLYLFQNAGADEPSTWEELLNAARKITRTDSSGTVEISGYAARFDAGIYDYNDLEVFMQQLGATTIEVGSAQASMNNSTGRQALQFMSDLFHYGMPDQKTRTLSSFMSGKTAVYHWAPLGHKSFTSIVPSTGLPDQTVFRRYVGPTPQASSVQYLANTLLMNSDTQHPEEAWRVMKAFISSASIKGYLMAHGLEIPPRKSLFTDYDLISRPFVKEATALLSPPLVPLGSRHMSYSDFRGPAGEYLKKALYGEIAIQTALEQAEVAINSVISDNSK